MTSGTVKEIIGAFGCKTMSLPAVKAFFIIGFIYGSVRTSCKAADCCTCIVNRIVKEVYRVLAFRLFNLAVYQNKLTQRRLFSAGFCHSNILPSLI